MTQLNEDVLPIVWSLARRELQTRPAPTLDELVHRLTPTGLLKRERAEQLGRVQTSRHVRPSLIALLESGAATRDGDRVHLVAPTESDDAFRLRVLRGLLCSEGVDRDEAGEPQPYQAEAVLAWLHLEGLAEPVPASWNGGAQAILQRRAQQTSTVWLNDAAFNTLERWARWFGWVRRARRGGTDVLWPDATPLVRALLPEILDEPMPVRRFVDAVARRLPWLPNGRVGTEVSALFLGVPDRSADDGRVPEGLSLALERLRMEESLRLVGGDDAQERMLLSAFGRPTRSYVQVSPA